MKTYKILFEHYGENSDTAKSPVAVWDNQVDLSATRTCCTNWDDNSLVSVNRYQVLDVTLPNWLDANEWIRNALKWQWAWDLGVDASWPESWQRWFIGKASEAAKLAIIKLLKTKNFRSEFRQSLRDQFVQYVETPEEARQYNSPFSPRQWDKLIDKHTTLDARRMSNDIYYAHRHAPHTGAK